MLDMDAQWKPSRRKSLNFPVSNFSQPIPELHSSNERVSNVTYYSSLFLGKVYVRMCVCVFFCLLKKQGGKNRAIDEKRTVCESETLFRAAHLKPTEVRSVVAFSQFMQHVVITRNILLSMLEQHSPDDDRKMYVFMQWWINYDKKMYESDKAEL